MKINCQEFVDEEEENIRVGEINQYVKSRIELSPLPEDHESFNHLVDKILTTEDCGRIPTIYMLRISELPCCSPLIAKQNFIFGTKKTRK